MGLLAQRRVREEDRRPAETERLGEVVEQALANKSHADWTMPLASQRGHRLVTRSTADQPERHQVRVDIQDGPVPRHPVADRHANARHSTVANPDAPPPPTP